MKASEMVENVVGSLPGENTEGKKKKMGLLGGVGSNSPLAWKRVVSSDEA